MIQTEFPPILRMFGQVQRRMRDKRRQTAIDYTLKLSAALRVFNLSHSVHDVMCAVAALEHERGHATIPQMCLRLACTYQAVMQHFLKNPDIFLRDEAHKPARYTLAPEGIRLLHKIRTRVNRHECH